MFSCYMLFEIARCRSLVTTVVTCEPNTFMYKFYVRVHNSLLGCLVITLVTVKFYPGMHYHYMFF